MLNRFLHSTQNGTWVKEPIGLESIYFILWSFCNVPLVTVLVILVLISASIKWIALKKYKIVNFKNVYILLWFLIPFCLIFIVSYKVPMFLDRYLIFTTPALYFLIIISLNYLFQSNKMFLSLSTILILAFALSVNFNPPKKRQVESIVRYIKEHKNANTLVLICPFDFMTNFAYYYNQSYFENINQSNEYSDLENFLNNDHVVFINKIDSNLLNKIKAFNTILYLDVGADFSMPENKIKETLDCEFKIHHGVYSDNFFQIFNYTVK